MSLDIKTISHIIRQRMYDPQHPLTYRRTEGVGQTGPRRGPIDIIGSAEGRAAYPREVCLRVHRRSILWGGPSPVPEKLARR